LTARSDAQLVAGALEGREKAFRELVERYHPVAFAVVRSVVGDREDVEDVVQEVFIKVYKGLSHFRGDAKFSTWIYRIARNEAINAARKKVITGQPVEETVIESPVGSRPDEQFHQKAERSHLEGYLARLDENYRTVLELRYLGERSYAEIGEAMELPIGTVKSYIHRAKIELKRLMTRSADTKSQQKS
jgi:RNA polymerase sigma-70 factor (ECF subfamily)